MPTQYFVLSKDRDSTASLNEQPLPVFNPQSSKNKQKRVKKPENLWHGESQAELVNQTVQCRLLKGWVCL